MLQTLTEAQIKESVEKLLRWMEDNEYAGYDHYDLWSSRFGIWSRRLFSSHRLLGAPCVAVVYLQDIFFPGTRKIFAKRHKSAEAIPRIASAYFKLFKSTKDKTFLKSGCSLLAWLNENSTATKHGLGWGLHFDWPGRAYISKNTPCVTLTAYSTQAFLEGYSLTHRKEYLETALKTGDFVAYDLNRKNEEYGTALSYTPLDHNYVINANSYAAGILMETLKYHKDPVRCELIDCILNYVLAQQNSNGSWYYFDKNEVCEGKNFIDSFHTCFVLENLYSLWKWNNDPRLKNAVDRGYEFFTDNFITGPSSVRYYYSYPYPTGVKVDIRGCAEAIHCLAVLSEIYPEALDLAVRIAEWTIKNMQGQIRILLFSRLPHSHQQDAIHQMGSGAYGQCPDNSADYVTQ